MQYHSLGLTLLALTVVFSAASAHASPSEAKRLKKAGYIESVYEAASGEAAIAVTRKFMLLPMVKQTQLVADVCKEAIDLEPTSGHVQVSDCFVERNGERVADVGYDASDDTMAVEWQVWYKLLIAQREFARAK
jgi:hypothetical protein